MTSASRPVSTFMTVTVFLLYNAVSTAATLLPEENIKLTPTGAEQRGNGRDIPDWQGGLARSSAISGSHEQLAAPYAQETPILRISSANMKQHQARLTPGQQQLLTQNPDLYLSVYPSHRSASYPDFVYQALARNDQQAQLLPFGSGISNASVSSPFPTPANGMEAIWNHILRYRGRSSRYSSQGSLVEPDGQISSTLYDYEIYFPYTQSTNQTGLAFMLTRYTRQPASRAGITTLMHESLDLINSPRKTWLSLPEENSLRRTADIAYDTIDPDTDGLRTIDQVDMYNGAPNQYDWVLIGKQELYIPYNAYALNNAPDKWQNVLQARHLNPELLRYEAHRVWVVDAHLRKGVSHRHNRRRFYMDEDSWSIVYAEEYNANDQLAQLLEAHTLNFHDQPLVLSTLEVTYDFSSARYYAEGLSQADRTIQFDDPTLDDAYFSSSRVRRRLMQP